MIEKIINYLFKHRHKWEAYTLLGNENKTYFYCRRCFCGADEIKNAGPMGNGKWVSRSLKLDKNFEQKWIDNAIELPNET